MKSEVRIKNAVVAIQIAIDHARRSEEDQDVASQKVRGLQGMQYALAWASDLEGPDYSKIEEFADFGSTLT